MALRDDVLTVLNALCEGAGVCEDADGDFAVDLHSQLVWARVFESPPVICLVSPVAGDVPLTPEVQEELRKVCERFVVFRLVWDDGVVLLRADLAASPFVPAQLQRILEDFDGVLAEVAPLAQEWSKP